MSDEMSQLKIRIKINDPINASAGEYIKNFHGFDICANDPNAQEKIFLPLLISGNSSVEPDRFRQDWLAHSLLTLG